MRGKGAIALVALLCASCDDDCKRSIGDYCDGHGCGSYEARRAALGGVAPCEGGGFGTQQATTWECGPFKAIESGNGYGGVIEYYDRNSKLAAAVVYGDVPDDNGCFEYAYGFDLSACTATGAVTCLGTRR